MDTPFGLPHVAGPHKNGDNVYGFYGPTADVLVSRGTPTVSIILRRSVTSVMADVRVGDRLQVSWDGKHWLVYRHGALLGRLTWPSVPAQDPDNGSGILDVGEAVLEVHRVFVSTSGDVVNLGGIAYPPRHPALEEPWGAHVNA